MSLKISWLAGCFAIGISCIHITSLSAQNPQTAESQNPQRIIFQPRKNPQTGVGWEITTTSGPAEAALAQHLVNTGAKLYVAWWCPHCHEQKMLFGKRAYQLISDNAKIECDSRGRDARPALCQAAKIQAYPTWVINGRQYVGVQNLDKLARISGYQGNTNFKYFHKPRFF